MRTEPVKFSTGPCREGGEPLRVIVIAFEDSLEAVEGAAEPETGVP
jgi:hypothetical protein